MATHTPGPWEHLPDNNDAIAAVNRRADRSIASFVSLATMNPLWPEMRDQQEANARLMAAAPDLLAAAKALDEMLATARPLPGAKDVAIDLDALLAAVRPLRDAVRKAEGR